MHRFLCGVGYYKISLLSLCIPQLLVPVCYPHFAKNFGNLLPSFFNSKDTVDQEVEKTIYRKFLIFEFQKLNLGCGRG